MFTLKHQNIRPYSVFNACYNIVKDTCKNMLFVLELPCKKDYLRGV